MFDVPVIVEQLNCQDKIHILLIDFLLKQAIDNLSTYEHYWSEAKQDRIYIYLIQSNDNRWRVTLFPIELAAKATAYKYRAVIEITVGELLIVLANPNMRYEIIKRLLPSSNTSSVISYFDFKKECTRELN